MVEMVAPSAVTLTLEDGRCRPDPPWVNGAAAPVVHDIDRRRRHRHSLLTIDGRRITTSSSRTRHLSRAMVMRATARHARHQAESRLRAGAIGCLIYRPDRRRVCVVDVFPDWPMPEQQRVKRGSFLDMPPSGDR